MGSSNIAKRGIGMKKPLEKTVSLRLTEEDLLLLQAIAQREEVSVSALIRQCIRSIREGAGQDEQILGTLG